MKPFLHMHHHPENGHLLSVCTDIFICTLQTCYATYTYFQYLRI